LISNGFLAAKAVFPDACFPKSKAENGSMSSLIVEKLPPSKERAIRAGKRLQITEAGRTIAFVEPNDKKAPMPKRARTRLTAQEWISTVGSRLSARPDLNSANIVRLARDAE